MKAKQVGYDFLLHFPNKERLQELINFPVLTLKFSGARVEVVAWSSKARTKARLHTFWVNVENVPEKMLNYRGVCETGSMIGAVEEVDMNTSEARSETNFSCQKHLFN